MVYLLIIVKHEPCNGGMSICNKLGYLYRVCLEKLKTFLKTIKFHCVTAPNLISLQYKLMFRAGYLNSVLLNRRALQLNIALKFEEFDSHDYICCKESCICGKYKL